MSFFSKVVLAWVAVLAGANGVLQLQPARAHAGAGQASASSPPGPPAQPAAPGAGSPAAESPHQLLLRRYCTSCHSDRLKTAGLSLEALDLSKVGDAAETWEKVVWKLRGGIMPPVGRPRPDAASIDQFASYVESELDRAAAASPNPGRVPVHRLNRAEYANAIRDLLALEINGPALLPADEVGHGSTTSPATSRCRRPSSNAICRRAAASAGWRSAIRPSVRLYLESTSCRSTRHKTIA
jgi:cytochrome c551/c552